MSARPMHRKDDDDASSSFSGIIHLASSEGGVGWGERGAPRFQESSTLRRSASDPHQRQQRPTTLRRWKRHSHMMSSSLLGRAWFRNPAAMSRKRDYNAYNASRRRHRRRTVLLTLSMILISLTWMYFSYARVQSANVEAALGQRQRAERLAKLVFLTDRHSSAEWQASPILEEDDDHVAVAAAARRNEMPPTDESESATENSNENESNQQVGMGPQLGDPQDEATSLESVLKLLANLSLSDPQQRNRQLEEIFDRHRIRIEQDPNPVESQSQPSSFDVARRLLEPVLQTWLHHWNQDVLDNVSGGSARWVRPYLLRPDHVDNVSSISTSSEAQASRSAWVHQQYPEYFAVARRNHRMKWQDEWDAMSETGRRRGPVVDYTSPDKYEYSLTHTLSISDDPVPPQMQPVGELLTQWQQNDDQPARIRETLAHFDYANSQHMRRALQHRRAGIPFKVVNVPDVAAVQIKWTDEYLSKQSDEGRGRHGLRAVHSLPSFMEAVAIESINNFFVPYEADKWDIFRLGLAPTRDVTDWTYAQWSRHAQYADAVRLGADQPHFAWQVGAEQPSDASSDRSMNGTFVSRDLPILTNPDNQLFAGGPSTPSCRFGERGSVTAMSYGVEPTFVAVITGAVRYVLSPPAAVPSNLCVDSSPESALYRHSALDLAHLTFTTDAEQAGNGISTEERECLKAVAAVDAVETVVKAGEVLYIPSVSLQKSAQCTVQSGYEGAGSLES